MACLDCEREDCEGCNPSNWVEHTLADNLKMLLKQYQEKEVIYQQRLKARDAEIDALRKELKLLKGKQSDPNPLA